ncbi:MAG: MerR family DNA-binding transcriptional regulator [Chrysiogenetes bacterium]|nr:MerR family DNA-binding transcriptional regulator [Chrysiogenetes bacterium]
MSADKKEHFGISDLSKEFGITARTLRHYEDEGLLKPERRGSQRLYTAGDRVRLILILRGRAVGFSIPEIKEIITLYNQPTGVQAQRKLLLEKVETRRKLLLEKMSDLKHMLGELDALEKRVKNDAPSRKGTNRKRAPKRR